MKITYACQFKNYPYARHTTDDSISYTDYQLDVPVNITLPRNTFLCYITDKIIPVSCFEIEERRNKIFHLFITTLITFEELVNVLLSLTVVRRK